MTIEFRPLQLHEMKEASRVLRAAFDWQLPWLAGLHTPDEDTWFFREVVFAENQIWGAVEGGAIVGMIAFTSDWVHQLYVLPEAHGRGIGSALLAIAQVDAKELQLWTFQKNAQARRFYEVRGFVAVRETDGTDNEEKEPDILYVWTRSKAIP